MYGDRSLSLLVQPDQWARCAHDGTALLPGGGVELDWADDDGAITSDCHAAPAGSDSDGCGAAGLAWDRWCRAYRSRPSAGVVDVYEKGKDPVGSPCPGTLRHPASLAIDTKQRLYIAESVTNSVLVADLWARRLLRRVPLGQQRPLDLATDCGRAVVLVRPHALLMLDGRRAPRPGPALVTPRRHGPLEPRRVAHGPLVLWRGDERGVVARPDGTVLVEVPGATDLDVTADGMLVVARGAGQSLRRFEWDGASWVELQPIGAPGYDGGAISIAPDGRVTFTTEAGIATTTGSAARHHTEGSVITYRLDSGSYRTRWGRLFLDACLPSNTSLSVRFITSDVDDVPDPVPASPPGRGARKVPAPEDTPPLPSQMLLDALGDPSSVFRRPSGRELPWEQIAAEDIFETYESPVLAEPGRYLWIEVRLAGTQRVTPRVRALRVDRPGHQLLNSLPLAWSRDDESAGFLQRFLAPAEGILHELDWRAEERATLLDPLAMPQETLPWLASFAGLVLDRRWPEQARRTLIAEAYRLFARRGTKAALVRILAIYLGRDPVIIERWQLRGLGGTVLGTSPEGPVSPAVGGSARATGTLGRFTIGGVAPNSDSYTLSAHRFAVLIPGELTPEQRQVVRNIMDVHRPAHTICDICELGDGMRVGQHLRIQLTSFVGPGASWAPAVLGQTLVGGDGIVGTPSVASRLGENSVAGKVRVG